MIVAGRVWRMLAGSPGVLDAVFVVADAFHCSRTGAFGAVGDQQGGDFGQVVGEFGCPVLRRN